MTSKTPVLVVPTADRPLTAEQRRFNQLVQRIERARQDLSVWHDQLPLFHQAHTARVRPVIEQIAACQRDTAQRLDALLDGGGWSKTDRRTVRRVLCELTESLIQREEDRGADVDDGGELARLKALHDKHAEVDFDTARQHGLDGMKNAFEAVTGVDLGDDPFESEEAFLRHAAERLDAARDAQAQTPPPQRKPASAAQRRREQTAQAATQSVREVYRKLTSALHPDRARDEDDRVERTALMKRVNQAYDASDLLALLALQLEIEQVDVQELGRATAERAQHYNRVLSDQLRALQAQIQTVHDGFCMEFGLDPDPPVKPHQLGQLLERALREARAALAQMQRERRLLDQPGAAKRWVKQMTQALRHQDFDSYLDGAF